MKDFFSRYSYNSVRLFLNQIAIAMFGLVLALAAGMAENDTLQVVASVLSILFYLFLEYTVMWGVGAEDKISIDLGKRRQDLTVPVKMWLLSNSLNIILAVLITLGMLLSDIKAFSTIGGISSTVALLIEGMYTGLLTVNIAPDVPLNSLWITYYLITLPALVVVFFSYLLGVKGKRLGNMLVPQYPESDRDNKKKK